MNSSPLLRIAFALPLFFASVIASTQTTVLEGAALTKSLQDGVWCNSYDDGKTCWAYDQFLPSGVIRACGQDENDKQPFWAEATFEVQGRFTCFRVTKASENFGLKPGLAFCTEVLAIDQQTQRYRDLQTNEVVTLYRRSKSAWKCKADT